MISIFYNSQVQQITILFVNNLNLEEDCIKTISLKSLIQEFQIKQNTGIQKRGR